ncbi:MAG: nucleotidyltransferase [Phycisphaerae bacterium]
MVKLPPDFREFLSLLHTHRVKYLLVGGYAVAAHGYPRFTGDMDVWIQTSSENAENVFQVCRQFGFNVPNLRVELFTDPKQLTRMGHPPLRIEILNSVSGLSFEHAWENRIESLWDGVPVMLISLRDLRINKQASGRFKDLADLENLPES